MEVLGYVAVVAVSMSLFGLWIASQKGRAPTEGLVLGLFFGPLGVLVEALLPARETGGLPSPRQRPVARREGTDCIHREPVPGRT